MEATEPKEPEKMNIEVLREKMDNRLDFHGRSSSTKQKYHRALKEVYKVIPDLKFSRDNIERFLAIKRRKGYKSSVVRFNYFFLKSLVENVVGGKWPFRKEDIPTKSKEPYRPVFEESRINEMIGRTRKVSLPPADLTRFAISTTYGARRIELAQLNDDSFDLERKVVRIETRKRGEPRTHVLPEEIIPYLHPEGLEPVSVGGMSRAFIRIEESLGFTHQKGFGFHSIRRRLATWLDDHSVGEEKIFIFMRWTRRRTILDEYIVRTLVETERKQAEVDREIFKIHPFLPAWGGKGS